jgi:cell division protein FtsQ
MSRVRGRGAVPPPRLQDRPGRWKLIWRNQRRRLRTALLLGGVIGSVFAGLYSVQAVSQGADLRERLGTAAASLGLRIQKVQIEGRTKTPQIMLDAALGIRPGEPILAYSLSEARTRLESIKWVEHATVERRLPGTIIVRLVERRPFAVWQIDGQFRLVDRDGKVVADSDVATFAGQLPLVVGAGAPAAAADLMEFLSPYPQLASRMVAAVRVGERRWNLRMNNGADVMLPEGAEAPALAKLAELQASHSLLDRPLAVVDLRLPDRLVVRPQTDPKADPKNPQQGRRT